MTQSHRSHDIASHAGISHCVTAGVALIGCSMIAVTPVALPLPVAEVPTLRLTSSIDPTGLWADVIHSAPTAIAGNLEDKFAAATFVGVDVASQVGTTLAAQTLDFNHLWALQYLSGMDMGMGVVPISPVEPAATVLTLLSSPLSGVLMGMFGALISPEVALINSIGAIADSLGGGNPSAAVQDLLATPANVVGALFNGATLSLDPLLPLLNEILQVPDGNEIIGASLDFGGLLSPGVTEAGNVGGSIFNALGLDLIMVGMGMPYSAPGEGIGLIGAVANLADMITETVG